MHALLKSGTERQTVRWQGIRQGLAASRTRLAVERARSMTLRLRPADIHPLQHLSPVLGIRAAGPCLQSQGRVDLQRVMEQPVLTPSSAHQQHAALSPACRRTWIVSTAPRSS